ncbi:hypothetical protein DFH09DRAFT_1329491 [Mycena vulgaris]|nr:hypothetical protein DFH09DRAFT_1329491 [Mycena vulgaris]
MIPLASVARTSASIERGGTPKPNALKLTTESAHSLRSCSAHAMKKYSTPAGSRHCKPTSRKSQWRPPHRPPKRRQPSATAPAPAPRRRAGVAWLPPEVSGDPLVDNKNFSEREDLTPLQTPQRHQQRARQRDRDIRESQEASPRRRRVPTRNNDETVPPSARTPAEPSAQSLGQMSATRGREKVELNICLLPHLRTDHWGSKRGGHACVLKKRHAWILMTLHLRGSEIVRPPRRGILLEFCKWALQNGLQTPPQTQRAPSGGRDDRNAAPRRPASPHPNEQVVRAAPRRGRRPAQARDELFMVARREYRDPVSRHDLGNMDDACPTCGALHWEAEKVVQTPKDSRSPYGLCCNHGKVALNRLDYPPEPLHRLLLGHDTQAQEFREHITQYNTALAFTSLGVNDNKNINKHGPGAWVFRILGHLRHLSGALEAADGTPPSYAQLYMYDPSLALQ